MDKRTINQVDKLLLTLLTKITHSFMKADETFVLLAELTLRSEELMKRLGGIFIECAHTCYQASMQARATSGTLYKEGPLEEETEVK